MAMDWFRGMMLVFALIVCGARPVGGVELRVGGWLVPWDVEGGRRDALLNPNMFEEVSLFMARLGADGLPRLDKAFAREAAAGWSGLRSGLTISRLWLTVVNDVETESGVLLKDRATVVRVLSEADLRAAHIEKLVELARMPGVIGIELDYEGLQLVDAHQYAQFVEALGVRLHAISRSLAVVVPAKSEAGRDGYIWSRLARASDVVRVMAYEEHGTWSGPGPVATLGFLRRVAEYALGEIPGDRCCIALGAYGFDWPAGGGGGVLDRTYAQAQTAAAREGATIQRTPGDDNPWYRYRDNSGGSRVVWFEDAQSLGQKVRMLSGLGIRNFYIWRMGGLPLRLESSLLEGSRKVPREEISGRRGSAS